MLVMKELTIILLCTFKFAATFPLAIYAMKMSFAETLLYTNIGGILGAVVFIFFSDLLIRSYKKYWPEYLKFRQRGRIVFTKRNRRLVSIKVKYGLYGIVILSPLLLSIPVGSFLTAKYYGTHKSNIILLIAGQAFWSVVYTFVYTQTKVVIS